MAFLCGTVRTPPVALAAGVLGVLSTLVFAFVYLPFVAALVPALLVIGVSVAARHDVSA